MAVLVALRSFGKPLTAWPKKVDHYKMDEIKDDVIESIKFSKHGRIRGYFDELTLIKPSVSFIMELLSVSFILLWVSLVIHEIFKCI